MSDLGNKEVMATNINRLMRKYSVDRKKLSADTGISYTTLSSWLQKESYPRIDKIEKMANYFGVPKSELVEDHSTPDNVSQISHVRRVPIIGTIACGEPITADENIEGYVDEYFTGDAPSGKLFELKCHGDSMEPTVPDGAKALIRQQSDIEDGEIAAVLFLEKNEATLKRVRRVGNKVLLVPDNPRHKTIALDGKTPVKILGKLIRYTVDF